MPRVERIIIANDNAPLFETAQKSTRMTARKSRRNKPRAGKTLLYAETPPHSLRPGQMEWQPQNKILPGSEYSKNNLYAQGTSLPKTDKKTLKLGHVFLLSTFTILIMASIVSLFYGFRPEISGGLTGATALFALMGLSLPKSHKRKREFLGLSTWVTAAITVNIFYPLTTIEFLTFASVLGFVLSMLLRLLSPAVAATLTLASLVAVVWPQLGLF